MMCTVFYTVYVVPFSLLSQNTEMMYIIFEYDIFGRPQRWAGVPY